MCQIFVCTEIYRRKQNYIEREREKIKWKIAKLMQNILIKQIIIDFGFGSCFFFLLILLLYSGRVID